MRQEGDRPLKAFQITAFGNPVESRTSRRYSGAWPSGSRTSNHPHGNFADRAKDLSMTIGRDGISQASGDRRSNTEDD